MAYSEEAPPGRGAFFRLQVFEKVKDFTIKVYGTVGKSVILVGKKGQKGKHMHFTAVKKSRKRSRFVIYSNFNPLSPSIHI